MTDPRETLNRIRKQADNATKGPWVCVLNGDESEVTYANAPITWDDHGGEVFTEGDAEFIAHARTDVPALVATLRAVLEIHKCLAPSWEQERDEGLRDWCGECEDYWPCPTVETIRQHLGEDA